MNFENIFKELASIEEMHELLCTEIEEEEMKMKHTCDYLILINDIIEKYMEIKNTIYDNVTPLKREFSILN